MIVDNEERFIKDETEVGFLIVEGYLIENRKRIYKKWNTGLYITRKSFDEVGPGGLEIYIEKRGGANPPSNFRVQAYYFHRYRPDF